MSLMFDSLKTDELYTTNITINRTKKINNNPANKPLIKFIIK